MITIRDSENREVVTLVTGENNGPGAVSNPFALSYIPSPRIVYVRGDMATKFVPGFKFRVRNKDAANPSPNLLGDYEVVSAQIVNQYIAVTTNADLLPSASFAPVNNLVIPITTIDQPDGSFIVHYHVNGNVLSQYTVGETILIYNNVSGDIVDAKLTDVVFVATSNKTRLSVHLPRGPRPDDNVIARSVRKPVPTIGLVVGDYSNTAVSSLQLFGPGSVLYNVETTWGQSLLQNLYNLLTNFAGPTPPVNPRVGQQWYDTTAQATRSFDGSDWSNPAVAPLSSPMASPMMLMAADESGLFTTTMIEHLHLDADVTPIDLTSLQDGHTYKLVLTQGAGSGKAVTYNANCPIAWTGGKEPLLSGRAGYSDVIELVCVGGMIYGNMVSKGHRISTTE